jgi:hypothetical protein
MRGKLPRTHDAKNGTRRETNMIDGRFDQHFLEIFAREQPYADAERKVPWNSVVPPLLAVAAALSGAIFLMK